MKLSNKIIDCFIIGFNQVKFQEYERHVRNMGLQSGAYRDLNLNFIKYNDDVYTLRDVFNSSSDDKDSNPKNLLNAGNIFSATISYLGTFLNKNGYTFDYINSFQEEKEYLREKLIANNIRMIAITTTFYVSITPIVEIIEFIRKNNTSVKIMIGGPYVATQIRFQDENSLQYLLSRLNADFYINSAQGEQSLIKVLNALKNNMHVSDIPNVIYKYNKKYKINDTYTENNPLNENKVNWELFKPRLTELALVRTAISCPFTCAFCGFPEHAGRYQNMSIDVITEELDMINSIGVVRSINFIDDTFNVPNDRFRKILKLLIDKKYRFRWNSHFRCQFADEKTIELMKESGCQGVFLGIESGNQMILNNMNKHSNVESYIKGIELLKKYEIITYSSFIVGFPGENEETVNDTKNFIESTQPDFYRAQLWYCDSLTPIWKLRDKYGIKNSQFEWSHDTMYASEALDLIEQIFMDVKGSIWLPQNDFDYPGIFNLLNRGWDLPRIKQFILLFNEAVKEKIMNNSQTHPQMMEKMKLICNRNKLDDCGKSIAESDKLEAEFNF